MLLDAEDQPPLVARSVALAPLVGAGEASPLRVHCYNPSKCRLLSRQSR